MPLNQCPNCGQSKGFKPNPQRYSKTEWWKCLNCDSDIFRVGSSFGL